MKRPVDPPIEGVAAVAQRLAVLLTAGVSPVSAWTYLLPDDTSGAASGVTSGVASGGVAPSAARVVRAAAAAGRGGGSIADAVAAEAHAIGGQGGDAWLGLAAAWAVATQAGAPLAACLRELAGSFRDVGQVHRDLAVALAGPQATARMVMALPLVGILLGSALGFNTLQTLFLTVPGLACLAVGTLLMAAAARWNRRLVRSARARDPTPGLALDLTAIGMAGGGSVTRARALVLSVTERYGVGAGEAGAELSIDRVLALSARAGVPAAELLRSEAEQLRRDARSAGQSAAATLSVTLMIPLGLCVLPAFMLVGVLPLLLTVLSSTLRSF